MTGRAARLRRVVVAACRLGLAFGVAACGVPMQDAPDRLGGDPPQALPTVATTTSLPGSVGVVVYLVSGERLAAVPRSVSSSEAGNVLAALFQGPTREEAAEGLRTAIAPAARLRAVTVEGDIARVDTDKAFAEATGPNRILAVAQVVFTATELADVARVRITVYGEAIEVTRADGTLTSGALTRDDFAGLA